MVGIYRIILALGIVISVVGCQLDVEIRGDGAVVSSDQQIDCGETCSALYGRGETPVSLMATPSAGYLFAGWQGACSAAETERCELIMRPAQTPVTVVATFAPIPDTAENFAVAIRAVGVSAPVTLQQGSQRLSIDTDGNFEFPHRVAVSEDATVSIVSEAGAQTCALLQQPEAALAGESISVYLSCAENSAHVPNPNITIEEALGASYTLQPALADDQFCEWSLVLADQNIDLGLPASSLRWQASTSSFQHLVARSSSYDIRCTRAHGAPIVWTFRRDEMLFPNQSPRHIRITNTNDIAHFWHRYTGKTEVPHAMHILRTKLHDLHFLLGIRLISGNLYLNSNSRLASLAGLEFLQRVRGRVVITDHPQLTTLEALSRLQFIGGDLRLQHNPMLTSLTGLEGLEELFGRFKLDASNRSLKSLSGLDGLRFITNLDLIESSPGALATLTLNRLENIGRLTLEDPLLTTLAPFHNVSNIRELFIVGTEALLSLSGLNNIKQIDSMRLSGQLGFDVFEGVPGLESLGCVTIEYTGLRGIDLKETHRLHALIVGFEENMESIRFGETEVVEPWLNSIYCRPSAEITLVLLSSVQQIDFGALERIDGDLSISGFPELTSILGNEQLRDVSGRIEITADNELDLSGFTNIATAGSVSVRPYAASLRELQQVAKATSDE